MMKNYKIKVLVVEDENLLLKNIQKKITAVSPDFQIIGEAYNGKEALEIIRHPLPHSRQAYFPLHFPSKLVIVYLWKMWMGLLSFII